ncbi:MAG: toxin-antitoxin system HicB family antitoxin [bacterium]
MAKANVLTLRIPAELKQRIALVAEEQGISINQLAMYIFTKEIGNLEARQQIAKHWQGYSKDEVMRGFDEVMAKVKRRKVPAWDKLD